MLTDLERDVLGDIVAGIDPWGGLYSSVGSRRVTQAVMRLKRKGFVEKTLGSWTPMDAGRSALATAPTCPRKPGAR